MASKSPKNTPPPGGTKPRFEQPPKGKFIHQTFQTPKAVEMFRDEVQVVHKEIDAPGYEVGTTGDPHPDKFNYPGYILNVIIPAEDGKTAKYVYTIPRDPLIGYSTNQVKQLETSTQTLVNQSDTPPTPDARTNVKREDLANTKALQTVTTVPDIYPQQTYATSIPDVVPERFRVAVPTSESSSIIAGVPLPPILNTGDLAASSEQATEFTVKNSLKTRAGITLPKSLSSYKVTQEGQVASVTETLDNGLQTITPSALTVEGEVQNLGNGTSLKTDTEVGSVFPANTYITDRQDFRELPPEFRAKLPELATTVTSAGTASQPSLNVGDLQASSEQLTEFKVKNGRKARDLTVLPITLTDTRVTKEGQIETIARTLDTASQVVSTGATVTESEVHNLGDGMNLLTVGTVPSVFGQNVYGTEIPDVIPERFRAVVPTSTVDLTAAGTASPPTLGTGDLSITKEQVTAQKVRTRTKTRSSITLPVTLTGGTETNREKQVVTIVETLRVPGANPAPTATTDVDVTNLGNNTVLEIVKDKGSVFPAGDYEISIPNAIPIEFRALSPTVRISTTSAGTANPTPSLGFGEIAHKEEQINVFEKRVTVETLGNTTLPVTLLGQKLVKEYGGGLCNVVRTLGTDPLTADEGFTVVESVVQNLGNGYKVKETIQLADPSWPLLGSVLYDPEMRVYYPENRQIVAPGTQPVINSNILQEVKALDKWHSVYITTSKSPTAVSEATAIVSYVMKPYKFPGRFNSILATVYGKAIGHTEPRSDLARVTQKTWWVQGTTAPVINFPEIIPNTVYWSDSGEPATEFPDVLNDAFIGHYGGGYLLIPASTPSLSEFLGLTPVTGTITVTPSGGGVNARATITGVGTNFSSTYVVGHSYVWPAGCPGRITRIFSDTLLSVDQYDASACPSPVTHTFTYYVPNNTGFIGKPIVIAATVEPDRMPNLWKVTTQSVIMR